MGSFCIKSLRGKAPSALRIQKPEFRSQNMDFLRMAVLLAGRRGAVANSFSVVKYHVIQFWVLYQKLDECQTIFSF